MMTQLGAVSIYRIKPWFLRTIWFEHWFISHVSARWFPQINASRSELLATKHISTIWVYVSIVLDRRYVKLPFYVNDILIVMAHCLMHFFRYKWEYLWWTFALSSQLLRDLPSRASNPVTYCGNQSTEWNVYWPPRLRRPVRKGCKWFSTENWKLKGLNLLQLLKLTTRCLFQFVLDIVF